MKPLRPLAAALLALTITARADEEKKPATPTAAEPAATPEKKPSGKDATQEELEAKFKTTLTNATFNGRWCMIKDGKLTPEKEEKYTINGVNKLFSDRWLIRARIQYGDHDVTAPIPVKVKWAGDTAVITVDDFGLPGGASYSARVLVYKNTYAGTWSAGDHGGLLNGVITSEAEAPPK
jgi:hypothetical protein